MKEAVQSVDQLRQRLRIGGYFVDREKTASQPPSLAYMPLRRPAVDSRLAAAEKDTSAFRAEL